MALDPPPTNGSPLSWRDVYRAVGDAEERILKAVADLAVELRAQADDHEHRLRFIEETVRMTARDFPRLEGSVSQFHTATNERLSDMDRALLVAKAKADERGHLFLSTRTLVISSISIITSIIVATVGAITMLDRLGVIK